MPIDWDAKVIGPLENVFGEPATYLPAVGTAYAIMGVFDSAYKDVTLIDIGIEANAVQPVLGVRASAFRVPPLQGDAVRITSVGKLFLVRDVRPDGHGWIKLMLADTGNP